MSARAAALLLALAACAHTGVDTKYGKNAEEDYRGGVEALRVHGYPEASRLFEHVRTKYPFSQYAALSELRLADVKYDQDHNIEAADAYQQFVKLHPNHEQADYASYRAGLSYWRDGPSDFFLFPAAFEKDQAQVRDASKALAAFVQKYPDSKYRPEAEKVLATARARLADHEWYAAEFYAKRGHWPGAAGRLENIVKEYPGSPREVAALYQLAEIYLRMDEKFRAQQALQQLIAKHPQDPRRAQAEKLLASLR
ncbi:MAG TPA: outer membrane protein assembly factor BamD [Anaeromyxobacteraceae bacterium]